jgi:hypothetical protein
MSFDLRRASREDIDAINQMRDWKTQQSSQPEREETPTQPEQLDLFSDDEQG